MPLANVVATRTGTGWTIDVTGAQLSSNTAEKDFTVLHNGVGTPNVSYTKTTQFVLTYTGAALPTNTTVEIRRKTSFDNSSNYVSYANRFSSSTWNNALARIQRWEEEVDLNGAGSVGAGVIPLPQNDAYGAVWTNDIIYPATRKALWDKFELMAPITNPTFTGVPRANNAGSVLTINRLITHADVFDALAFKADLVSPIFTGTPTVPTQSAGDNTTKIASTAFVKGQFANTALTGTTAAPTPAYADNSTKIATTAYVDAVGKPNFRVYRNAAVAGNTGGALLTWTGEDFDTASAISTGAFTAPYAGTYFFGTSVYVLNTAGVLVNVVLYFNKNAGIHSQVQQSPVAAGTAVILTGTAVIPLTAGETVSVQVTNFNGGATYTIGDTTTQTTFFHGFRIST